MIFKKIIKRSINSFEKKTGYDTSYMREMADVSPLLAFQFSKFIKLNNYRRETPRDEMFIAKIAAMKTEDCGTCLQLNINFALWEGMNKQYVVDAVQKPENLPKNLKLIYDFSHKVATNSEDIEKLSEKVESLYGRDVLVELSVAIATTRVYPAIKRGLGYAKSCSLIDFEFGK